MTPGTGSDVFFLLVGAILVFAMHAGFAFLEVGTVRHKNQINALMKILVDFGATTVTYFFIGYWLAYGIGFLHPAAVLEGQAFGHGGAGFAPQGLDLVRFFFLVTFAAAIAAIISGGVAERMRFGPQVMATVVIAALIYPFFEGIVWNGNFGIQECFANIFGAPFHDFAGSVVVHGVGGWLALSAVLILGRRRDRYQPDQTLLASVRSRGLAGINRPAPPGSIVAFAPSSIPWLALGSWLLCIGWFGFNVMTAGALEDISGLVAVNSLMSMVGGLLVAVIFSRNDPGFVHNGALAGLVAVCAGSDVMHPVGALITGGVAGGLFLTAFTFCQSRWHIDDVLGVWPLHGLCGVWGGIACGIFGLEAFWGTGGVSFAAQLTGSVIGAAYAATLGAVLYGGLRISVGIRLSPADEERGADLAIHNVSAHSSEFHTS